jgi:hypothetical protein
MRHGGGFRLLGVLLMLGVVAALTAGAYSAGYVAGAGTGATNVSPWVSGGAFGASGIVGLIVTVLILVVLFRVIRFAFWGHAYNGWERRGPGFEGGPGGAGGPGGPGGPGPWGWRGEHWRSNRRAAFDDWHRRAHDEQPGQWTGSAPTGGMPTGGTPAGGSAG